MADVIVIKGVAARRLKEEAERLDLSLDEYLLNLLTQNLDPRDRAKEYVEASEELLAEARKELEKGNVRQATEKVWGSADLAVKAYASWKDGKRLTSHKELWEYKRKLEEELGEWVYDAWMAANGIHTCFYDDWCTEKDVKEALTRVKKLVEEIKQRVLQTS
ncbi:MAG: PaREP1 family protein [Thermoproteales archaeon]|nr:PaREP1 family protein [Thermoproteales archaeon]